MSEWQPIETAPKDGTDVLLLSDEGVWQGSWVNIGKDGKYSRFIPLRMDEHGCGCCAGEGALASHWMPLPPAP